MNNSDTFNITLTKNNIALIRYWAEIHNRQDYTMSEVINIIINNYFSFIEEG